MKPDAIKQFIADMRLWVDDRISTYLEYKTQSDAGVQTGGSQARSYLSGSPYSYHRSKHGGIVQVAILHRDIY